MTTVSLSNTHVQLYDAFLHILKIKKFHSHPAAEILSSTALYFLIKYSYKTPTTALSLGSILLFTFSLPFRMLTKYFSQSIIFYHGISQLTNFNDPICRLSEIQAVYCCYLLCLK